MAAITSDQDAEFVASVGGFMMTNFQAVKVDVEKQLEEYLRRRVAILSEAHQGELERLGIAHGEAVAQKDSEITDLDGKIEKLHQYLNGLAAQVSRTRDLCFLRHSWSKWIYYAALSRNRKKVAAAMEVNTLRRLTSSRWSAWRMFTVMQSQRKRHEVLLRSREKKLTAEMDALKEQLAKQEVSHHAATEQTRTAFVRGICALNREAVQVLRGETGEDEAEAIESILRGGTTPSVRSGQSFSNHAGVAGYRSPGDELAHSSLEEYSSRGVAGGIGGGGSVPISPPHGFREPAVEGGGSHGKGSQRGEVVDVDWTRLPHAAACGGRPPSQRPSFPPQYASAEKGEGIHASSSRAGHGICPVHHVDYDGNFYHKCYNPIRSASASANRGSPVRSSHTPFVVRVDPSEGMPLGTLPLKRKR